MKIAIVALMVLFALLQIQMIAAHTIPLEIDTDEESHPEVRERRSTEKKVKMAEHACKFGKWVYDQHQGKKICEESNRRQHEKVRGNLLTVPPPTKPSYAKEANKKYGHHH